MKKKENSCDAFLLESAFSGIFLYLLTAAFIPYFIGNEPSWLNLLKIYPMYATFGFIWTTLDWHIRKRGGEYLPAFLRKIIGKSDKKNDKFLKK